MSNRALRRSQESLTSADKMSKYNEEAWLLATNPNTRLRDPHRAVDLAKKAIEQAPSNGEIWNTLGVASYRDGDWKAAESALRKSINLRGGGDSVDWFFLAMVNWRRGDKDRAAKWYHAACLWMARFGRPTRPTP